MNRKVFLTATDANEHGYQFETLICEDVFVKVFLEMA